MLLTVKSENAEELKSDDLFEVGTIAKVLQAKKNDEGLPVVLLEGLSRFRVTEVVPCG